MQFAFEISHAAVQTSGRVVILVCGSVCLNLSLDINIFKSVLVADPSLGEGSHRSGL